jgi:hypothetical protein
VEALSPALGLAPLPSKQEAEEGPNRAPKRTHERLPFEISFFFLPVESSARRHAYARSRKPTGKVIKREEAKRVLLGELEARGNAPQGRPLQNPNLAMD